MELQKEEIKTILSIYNISSFNEYTMIDSSHGEQDIRHNYIIDKKYVFRLNSAKVMSEKRVSELNSLVDRYIEFGYQAPHFVKNIYHKYIYKYQNYNCYVSEYLDYIVADDIKDSCREDLIKERVSFVARFAEKYKNVDLIDTLSMYSLFDLCPYDQLIGIDEKQENFNQLIQDLKDIQEDDLANIWITEYKNIRNELLSYYKELPRCVFQGDENFSNICVDNNHHIIGLFDFNMSGTEVIANYLANISMQGNYFYTEEVIKQYSAKEIYNMILTAYDNNTAIIHQHYHFTNKEYEAYRLYTKIVMISGYCNQYAFSEYLKIENYKKKIIELLYFILVSLNKCIIKGVILC